MEPQAEEVEGQAERDVLSTKQRLFVEYYLGQANGNATEAARLAGYAVPRQQGSENLSKPYIAAEISRRVKEAAMAADEVLFRLAGHARSSLADFVDLLEDGTWKVNLKRAEAAGKLHLLAELGFTEHGPKLKLVDSQAALVQLGRHHKLFTDKSEVGGPDGGGITVHLDLSQASEEELETVERLYRKSAPAPDPGRDPAGEGET